MSVLMGVIGIIIAMVVNIFLKSDALGAFLHQMYADEPVRWDAALAGHERLRFIINVLTRIRFVDASGALDLQTKEGAGAAPPGLHAWFEAPGRRTEGVTDHITKELIEIISGAEAL